MTACTKITVLSPQFLYLILSFSVIKVYLLNLQFFSDKHLPTLVLNPQFLSDKHVFLLVFLILSLSVTNMYLIKPQFVSDKHVPT